MKDSDVTLNFILLSVSLETFILKTLVKCGIKNGLVSCMADCGIIVSITLIDNETFYPLKNRLESLESTLSDNMKDTVMI